MRKIRIYGLMLTILSCIHCSEAESPEMACSVVAISGPNDDVIGKWKLVKVHTVFTSEGPRIEDHSCYNTVYHFQMDGILTISSDMEEYPDIPLGQHEYEFKHESVFEHLDLEYTLKIGNMRYACGIDSNMILDLSPLDGPILHFIRIK